MKVTIEVTAESKLTLVKELQNIIENISRYDRFDKLRKHSEGTATVQAEGSYAKFAVLDENDDYVSFHETWDDAVSVLKHPQTVLDMNKLL